MLSFFRVKLLPNIAGPARHVALIFTLPSTWSQISSVHGSLLILLSLTRDYIVGDMEEGIFKRYSCPVQELILLG